MGFDGDKTFADKPRLFFRTYVLTIPRFDLLLQGSLLILIVLDSNLYLLLARDAALGHLPGLVEDWLYMGVALAEFFLGAAIAWWGRRWRHLSLFGWLGATAVSSLLVLAFPYDTASSNTVELCGSAPVPYNDGVEPWAAPRIAMLVITAILGTLARISIWAHGVTYLDDHEPQNGPYFYGILISIRLSLGLSGKSWLRPGAVRDDWWVAHLTLSLMILVFALLFTLFPRRMPQYKEIDEPVEDERLLPTLGRVVRNKALVLQTCAMALMNTALFSFLRYDYNFVQARFHVEALRQDPRSSRAVGDIFRSMVIIFFIAIFRMRFSVRRSDGVKANTAARVGGAVGVGAAVFFVVLTVLGCGVGDIAGLTDGSYQQPACSLDCGCNSESYGYSPVCGLDTDTTYFSPCHAGCNDYEDLSGFFLFHNCTCGAQRAVRGGCALPSCRTAFSLYQIFFAIILAFTGASLLMQGMVVLRAASRRDTPVAVGAVFGAVSLLSHGPGHLIYMLISEWACVHKANGLCLFHQPSLWSLGAVSASLALLSGIISLVASRTAYPKQTIRIADSADSPSKH